MKTGLIIGMTALSLIGTTGCSNEKESDLKTDFKPASSVNALANNLYEKLAAKEDGNLFFSPYSVSSALAMTYGGARGKTADQMNTTLHFRGQGMTHPAFDELRQTLNSVQKKGHVQLSVANKLWAQKEYKFLPDYLAMTQEFYGSEIENIAFTSDPEAARLRINTWVEEQTQKRIQNLIGEGMLNEMTRLVLVNAIYFKGNWAAPFHPDVTVPTPFYLSDGKSVEVPMMSQRKTFQLAQGDGFLALELPYADNDLSMIILLPDEGKTPQITLPADLEFTETEVALKLPKFQIESSFGLNDVLIKLGMADAFNANKADFSGMDGSRELYIGAVLHKAFVEVDEKGTEAAAATGVIMMMRAMPTPPTPFVVDRPFAFVIRNTESGTILFAGRVMDPSN